MGWCPPAARSIALAAPTATAPQAPYSTACSPFHCSIYLGVRCIARHKQCPIHSRSCCTHQHDACTAHPCLPSTRANSKPSKPSPGPLTHIPWRRRLARHTACPPSKASMHKSHAVLAHHLHPLACWAMRIHLRRPRPRWQHTAGPESALKGHQPCARTDRHYYS